MKNRPIRGVHVSNPTPRRRFLKTIARGITLTLAGAAGFALRPSRARSQSASKFEAHEFAYISPLDATGEESTCHAELWYGWLDESVVVIVSATGWKARAIAKGRDRARVWTGNFGRWKGWLGTRNESFRRAASFDAHAERVDPVESDALLERLLALYERKYPDEIADWRDRMRSGARDGTRVLLRYTPAESTEGQSTPAPA